MVSPRDGIDPEHEAVLADSVRCARLVLLEPLAPAERVAFVLHDMFAVRFDDIATILGRSTAAATQLASRAPRRVQGASPSRRGKIGEIEMMADPERLGQLDLEVLRN